jgi:hypothetical protein
MVNVARILPLKFIWTWEVVPPGFYSTSTLLMCTSASRSSGSGKSVRWWASPQIDLTVVGVAFIGDQFFDHSYI